MIEQLISLGPYQWAGLLFGILYIIAAVRENPICWIFGIISCASIAIEDFTKTKLYQDGALQIFYILISIYGLYQWRKGTSTEDNTIRGLDQRQRVWIFIGGVILSLIMGVAVGYWTDAAFPIVDGLTTVYSVIATFLLVHKYYENWFLWIIIDLVYIYLYFDRAAPLFSLLYLIFMLMAIFGYWRWKKESLSK